MQQHQRVGHFRLAMMTLLLMLGLVCSNAATSKVLKAKQSNASNSTAEVITYDFAANPELLDGLATGITGWNNSNKNATITINNYTFEFYNCLRGSGYLSIRGDYNDKDTGDDPGYVKGSMLGTLTSMELQKRAGGGTLDIILEKSDGTLVTVSQEVAYAAGKVTVEIPADKQVADAKSITIMPHFKLNVSRIVINRLVAPQSTTTPWVLFKKLHADPSEATTFDADADTYEVAAGQIVQLVSNNIEGFDPVSTMSNPYVVTYYVGDVDDNTVPTFSAQTNSGHKFWRNGNDKDDEGNALGGAGYVYRRGIVLSKTTDSDGKPAWSNEGESLKVTVKVFKVLNVTGNTCTFEEVEGQTITKTFHFTSTPNRPDHQNLVFTPYTKAKTALPANADGTYTKPESIAVLDPTENITVSETGWSDDNTIVAKLSQSDEYDLQSLLNSASVSPTKRQKTMKSSSLKYRKISAMQYTPNGLASKVITEACYWFIPERKTISLKATSETMANNKLSLNKTSETESERKATITLHAYYTNDAGNETTVSLKDLGLKKSDITFTDNEVVAIDGDLTFNENGDAVFTLAASNNGQTSVGIRTQQTNNVNANTTDDTPETAVNYKAASTQFTVEVTGSDQLMPPTIQPYSQEFAHTFNATVKGASGVKTYYFLKYNSTPSTMTVTSDEQSTESTGDGEDNDLTPQDVVEIAIGLSQGDTDQEYINGGIIDSDGEAQVLITGKENAVYTIYAVTANVDDNGTIFEETAKNSSRIISATYTYNRLESPTLSPGIVGTTNAYPFSDESISVSANVESVNAKIYYALGKDLEFSIGDDGNVITNGTLFNSAEPIVVNTSTYVQAIAYNDSLRLTSDIVSYRYAKKSTDFDEPFFTINDGTYTNGDKYIHSLQSNQLTITARVYDEEGNATEIGGNNVNWDSDKYHIYYTLNGDAISTTSQQYSGPFTIDNTSKNVTVTAAVYADGTNGDHSMSDISVLYVLNSGINYWETSSENCTSDGVLKDLSTSINDASGEELVKVDFGSNMKQGDAPLVWKHYVSKEYATGNPIDNIGKYTIAPALDADEEVADVKDEMGNLWNHSQANDGSEDFQTHKATFRLPASGAYVKFEPKQNGTLTVWCCQEGALFYSNKSTDKESFNEGFIRKRPAYFVDEAGRSIKPAGVEAAGVLSSNWNMTANSGYWNKKGENINNIQQTLYTSTQASLIYNMFNETILANDATWNSPLQPLIVYLNTEKNKTVAGFNVAEDPLDESTDKSNSYVYKADENVDGTGVCLPSASYMKYTFDVKAGKTYFFFGWMTKIGIRGFGFEPATAGDYTTEDLTIYSGKDGTNNSTNNDFTEKLNKTYAKVKLQRTFAKDTWTTLVLPFSISASQLEEKFGTGTQVLHYRTIDNKTMYFFKHFQQMIVAGTPVLVKPTTETVNPEFNNVTIESTTVNDKPCYDYVADGNTEYPMMGSYTPQEYYNGNYYISTKGTVKQLYREDNTPAVLSGTRAYIVGKASDGTTTQLARMARSSYDDPTLRDMNDETTDIDIIVEQGDGETRSSTMGKDKVYNLNGQLLNTSTTTTDGLEKGVYVVDGKKVVVK